MLKMPRWALGVLIHFMLKCEMPFGSWRQSELDTFSKIAKGQLSLPQIFSPEAIDLITKVMLVINNLLYPSHSQLQLLTMYFAKPIVFCNFHIF